MTSTEDTYGLSPALLNQRNEDPRGVFQYAQGQDVSIACKRIRLRQERCPW